MIVAESRTLLNSCALVHPVLPARTSATHAWFDKCFTEWLPRHPIFVWFWYRSSSVKTMQARGMRERISFCRQLTEIQWWGQGQADVRRTLGYRQTNKTLVLKTIKSFSLGLKYKLVIDLILKTIRKKNKVWCIRTMKKQKISSRKTNKLNFQKKRG